MIKKVFVIGWFIGLISVGGFRGIAQQTITFMVTNNAGEPAQEVRITATSTQAVRQTCTTNERGICSLKLFSGQYRLILENPNFERLDTTLSVYKENFTQFFRLDDTQKPHTVNTVEITGHQKPTDLPNRPFMERIPLATEDITKMPLPKLDLESFIKNLGGGVVGGNEFSSQYRVRGGNYDENLVYIDDIEIYRPLLVRTGQQEGLGLTNPYLAQEVSFSTGGFQPQYGDKLSSVLDIKYKRPGRLKGAAEVGILTASAYVEGSSKNNSDPVQPGRFSYLFGARRFSMAYLLGTLDTKGEYFPQFYDLQSLIAYSFPQKDTLGYKVRYKNDGTTDTIYLPSEKLRVALLSIGALNYFLFRPQSRETTFGNLQNAFRLFVGYFGEERSDYATAQNALTVEHQPTLRLKMKHIVSVTQSEESEHFTVEGGYRLADVSTSFGSESYNEIIFVRGIGSELRNARNFLSVRLLSYAFRGEWHASPDYYKRLNLGDNRGHTVNFGFKLQQDHLNDQLREWNAVDSANYVRVREVITANYVVTSERYTGYLQDNFRATSSVSFVYGATFNYWTLNQRFLVSPRFQMLFQPTAYFKNRDPVHRRRDLQLRLAWGFYNQQPFYRELRDLSGKLYPKTDAQKTLHLIAGGDFVFFLYNRPFKLFTEAWYKNLENIIPYQIENVRVRYFPQYPAFGRAYGIDARINGQFIKDVESWISMGWMRATEFAPLKDVGFVRRPFDQRVNISIYFQDEIPRYPAFKVHINITYGSGLPFGPPGVFRNRAAANMPHYQRVDLGISRLIVFKPKSERQSKLGIETLWIGLDVFNLLARENTISYQWIKDIYDTQFAVPNYLSQRLLNLRLIANF